MSKTIDDKVVSLQFDNKNFEKNVATSMGTLDKLKRKLNFNGAEKSLNTLQKSSDHITFSKMERSLGALEKRFSSLGIVGMRTIENITDSMFRTGKKITSFVTSNIATAGKQRAMNVQRAKFQLEGMIADGNEVKLIMDQAKETVDGTAYRFDSAALAASQFAASGLRAGDMMKTALRGITGVAAMTNSQYEDISRIFTQVSGQGRVLGQDLLQLSSRGLNAAATIAKYLTEIGNGAKVTEADVREMVTKGQIDFETFATAMDKAFGAHAKNANKTVDGAFANVKAALSKIGELFYEDIIANEGPLVDFLNAVRLKINDIKAAVEPLVKIASGIAIKVINKLTEAIGKIDTSKLLGGWDQIKKKISDVGVDVDKFQNALKDIAKENGVDIDALIEKYGSFEKTLKSGWLTGKMVADALRKMSGASKDAADSQSQLNEKLKYFQDVVKQVWQGDFANGEERIKRLTEAGYEYSVVQDLVNKTVDDHTVSLEDLTDVQLEAIGYTDEEIKAIRELADEAEKAGEPLNKLIENLGKMSNLELIGDSFANIIESLSTLKNIASDAWKAVFPKKESKDLNILRTVLEEFNKFSKSLKISTENADKFSRIFKGLFSLISITGKLLSSIGGFFGGIFKKAADAVMKFAETITGHANIDLLELLAIVGDNLVAFNNWIDTIDILEFGLKNIGEIAKNAGDKIKSFFNAFINMPTIQNAIERFKDAWSSLANTINQYFGPIIDSVKNFINTLKEMDSIDFSKIGDSLKGIWESIKQTFSDNKGKFAEIGKNIWEGLKEGLKESSETVIETLGELAEKMIAKIKDVLGIHSPSTVCIEIGEDMGAGLFIGIQNSFAMLGGIMSELGNFLIRSLEQLDLTDVFAIGGFIAIMKSANQLIKSIDTLSRSVTGFGEVTGAIAGVFKSISTSIDRTVNRYLDVKTMEAKAAAFKSMALAVVEIAAALGALSLLDKDKLWNAAGAISAVMAMMTFMVKMMGSVEDVPDLGKFSLMIISIGIAVKLMSSTMKMLGHMDQDEYLQSVFGVIAIIGAFGVLAYAISSFHGNPGDMVKFQNCALSFIGVAIAIKMLTKSLKQIAEIEVGDLIKSGVTIGILMGALYLMSQSMSKVGSVNINFAGIAGMLLKLAAAFGIMAISFKIIGTVSVGDIWKAIGVLTVVGVFMAAMVGLSTAIDGKTIDFGGLGKMFGKIATSMLILGIAIKVIGTIHASDVAKAIAIITAIGSLMAAITFLSIFTGNWNKFSELGNMFMKLGVAFAAIAIAMRIIAGLEPSEINKAIGVVAKLSGFVAAITVLSLFAGKNASKAGDLFMKLAIAMGALVIVVRLLRGLNAEDISKGLTFINGCTVFFSALLLFSHFVGEHADKAANMLMKLIAPIAALAVAIIVLSSLDTAKLLTATLSMTMVMSALGLLMGLAGQVKIDLKSIGTMVIAVGAIAGILGLLSAFDVQSSIQNAMSLSTLLIALAAATKILETVETVSPNALVSMMVLALIVGALGSLLGVLNAYDANTTIQQVTNLSIMLGTLTAVTVVLSKIGSGSFMPALEGVAALSAVFAALTAVLGGIGALANKLNAMSQIETGIQILVKVATGLGDALGGFVGGALSFIPEIVGEIGEALNSFNSIDPNVGSTIKNVAGAIATLTASNIFNNLAKFVGADVNAEDITKGFQTIGKAIGSFTESIQDVDESAIEKAKNVSKILKPITELQESLPNTKGFFQKVAGFKDIEGFGEGVQALGTGLTEFISSISSVDIENENVQAKVTAAITALKGLAEMANSIPNTSGDLLSRFIVFNDIGTFKTGISNLGETLGEFITSLDGVNIENENVQAKVEAATTALLGLSELVSSIPDTAGEWLQKLIVFNDTSAFNTNISNLGDALGTFVEKIPDLTAEGASEKTTAAITVLEDLVKFCDKIPEEGFMDKLLNLGNISGFAAQLDLLAGGLKKFVEKSNDIGDIGNAEKAATALGVLVKALRQLDGFKAGGVSEFVSAINTLSGAKIKGFIDNFGADAIKKLGDIGKAMADSLVKGVSSKTDAMKTAITNLVNAGAAAVKTKPMSDAGKKVGEAFAKAVKDQEKDATNAGKTLNKAAADAANDDSGFYSAGQACVEGFAAGISENTFMAEAQAQAMAQAASAAARSALEVNSPSKVFRRIGYSIPEGFAQGIDRMSYMVKRSVLGMSDVAVYNSENALSKISLLTDSDFQPTIRPIMDLSNVRRGARDLNDLIQNGSVTSSIAAQSINNRMMPRHDSSLDIVRSIKELNKKLDNISTGNSYNINGITYDDGSNISEAIKELIRVAKIERRV